MKTRSLQKLHKKGAIEMSMQTIIVVVIGVTLLTLGLKFVYDTFQNIGGQQDQVSKATEAKISELFGESDNAISLPQDNMQLKQGKSSSLMVYIRNIEPGTVNAALEIVVDKANIPETANVDSVKKWFTYNGAQKKLDEGQLRESNVAITVPKTAKLGTYLVTFNIKCSEEGSVCGASTDFIINIVA
ncbi:MAG: hypothetical protein V1906_03355 [Candidatus Woesearchaeota archaeon]